MYVLKSKNNDIRLSRGDHNLLLDLWFRRHDDDLLLSHGLRCGFGYWFILRNRLRCGLGPATERKNYSNSSSNIMVGLLHNLGNYIILDIGSKCDMVRQPVFRSYTNIKRKHVLSRDHWVIVGSSDTGNDKGVEFTIGYKVIAGIDMIKSKVRV